MKKTMYINDPCHFNSLRSPYHPTARYNRYVECEVTEEIVRASVDEALDAGADIFANEIYGMVPWYPSRVHPLEEHLDWFYNEYGGKSKEGLLTFTQNGGDFVAIQCDETHKKGKEYFISYRLNDHHGMTGEVTPENAMVRWVTKFYIDHPEYRIGDEQPNVPWAKRHLDFRFPEVVNYKLEILYELIENYDLDGLMIDFLRSPVLFNQNKTTLEERVEIITAFFASLRAAIDKKAEKTGKLCKLGAKIPMDPEGFALLGIDIKRLSEVGVEFFDIFDYFCARQYYDTVALVKEQSGGKTVFYETSQAPTWRLVNGARTMRLSTMEQYYTTAYLAYKRGADGMSVFNFPWYRSDSENSGVYYTPPFEIFSKMKDEKFLAEQPQYYFEAATENMIPHGFDLKSAVFENGTEQSFFMDLEQPLGGFGEKGFLRLESTQELTACGFAVSINGIALEECETMEEPFPVVYVSNVSTPAQSKQYAVPSSILKNGKNRVCIRSRVPEGESVQLYLVSLMLP